VVEFSNTSLLQIYYLLRHWWGAGVVICLERGADLHMAQVMPKPLTVSCFSKIQIGFTFLVPAYPGFPGKEAVKWLLLSVTEKNENQVIFGEVMDKSLVSCSADSRCTKIAWPRFGQQWIGCGSESEPRLVRIPTYFCIHY